MVKREEEAEEEEEEEEEEEGGGTAASRVGDCVGAVSSAPQDHTPKPARWPSLPCEPG